MSRLRVLVSIAAAASVLFALVAPAGAADSDPDPLGILTGRGLTEQVNLGVDTITVNICASTDAAHNTETFTMEELVDWANAEVAPHFSLISDGRYTAVFVAGTEFTVAPFGGFIDDTACSEGSKDRTSTSNAAVVTRSSAGGGFGSSGLIFSNGVDVTAGDLSTPASESRRGFLIRGGSYPIPSTFAHELGHTLYWPHSGSTFDNSPTDYNNQMDLMSGGGFVFGTEWDNTCTFEAPGGGFFEIGDCLIIHTPAINRYASGWIDADRVEAVLRPGVSLELMGPEVLSGTAMALIPTADPNVYLTIDARPPIGYDEILPYAGLTVHEVDLSEGCDTTFFPCIGTQRRQQPAVPAIDSAAHVVELGDEFTIAGVTIIVTDLLEGGDGYRVLFEGVPDGCALGVNPFTDLAPTSFAFGSVGCLRLLDITTGDVGDDVLAGRGRDPRADGGVHRPPVAGTRGELQLAPPTPFTDVSASVVRPFADIACIYDLGVTTGTSGTTYGPDGERHPRADGGLPRPVVAGARQRVFRSRTDARSGMCRRASFAADDIACIFHLGITTGTSSDHLRRRAPTGQPRADGGVPRAVLAERRSASEAGDSAAPAAAGGALARGRPPRRRSAGGSRTTNACAVAANGSESRAPTTPSRAANRSRTERERHRDMDLHGLSGDPRGEDIVLDLLIGERR